MKKLKSIRTKLIPIITLIAVIPVIIATAYSLVSSTKLVNQKVNELTSQVALEKAAYVDEFISGGEMQTESLAKLLEGLEDINRENILSYVKSIKDSNDTLLFGYMGTENKEMFIYPSANHAPGYDPTSRPWYKDGIAGGGKMVITKPYKSASTGKYVATIAKAIKLKDGRNAVVGLDVEIIKLMESIARTKVGKTGYAVLLLQDGTILAHPDKELIMQNITEKFTWGKDVINKKNGNMNYENGKDSAIIGISQCPKTEWIVAAGLPESEYGEHLDNTVNMTLFIVLLVMTVSIFVGILIVRYITNPLTKLSTLMKRAEEGDFTIDVSTDRSDEIGQIQNSFKNLIDSQKSIISNIMNSSREILDSSERMTDISKESSDAIRRITSSIEEITSSSETNAAGVEEANAGIEEMSANAQTVAISAQDVKAYSEKSLNIANLGNESVDKAAESMELIKDSTRNIDRSVNELNESSKEIDTIVKTITSIASQTNLLALNAAIEAARAGESGRGFAVVADEVRKLAEESNNSAKLIETLIVDIQNKVQEAVETTQSEIKYVEEGRENTLKVKNALKEILESIQLVDKHIEDVAAASQEQSASSEEMAAVINNISSSIEENVKSTEEVSNAVQKQSSAVIELEGSAVKLEKLAEELSKEIERFKI